MIRLLLFFVALAFIAYGGMWLVQHPGEIELTWLGYVVHTTAALLLIAVAIGAIIVWTILRLIFGLPSFVRLASRQRRREKGYDALSRGLVAIGAGDRATAAAAAERANRKLGDEPLALMLSAQAAQLQGDDVAAVRAFNQLAARDDTRLFGLRGLFEEATRRGDDEAGRHFAELAYRAKPLPWSAGAMLDHHARSHQWEQALALLKSASGAQFVDRKLVERQRAVLETAVALDKETTEPEPALALARAAMRRAPDLAPPVALAARLLARRGDIRKATRLVERAWPGCPHPEVAEAYLDVRPGDSTSDRLARAKTLMNLSSHDATGRLTVARAALANKDFAAARAALEPLVADGKNPSVRTCVLMAEVEDAEHGDIGLAREWLARASRAPLDPAWIADGIEYENWSPVSPITGKLDAFRWQAPAERLGLKLDPLPLRGRVALPAHGAAQLEAPPRALPLHEQRPGEPDVGAVAAAELATTNAAEAAPVGARAEDTAGGSALHAIGSASEPERVGADGAMRNGALLMEPQSGSGPVSADEAAASRPVSAMDASGLPAAGNISAGHEAEGELREATRRADRRQNTFSSG